MKTEPQRVSKRPMKTEPPRVSKRPARAQWAPDAWASGSIFGTGAMLTTPVDTQPGVYRSNLSHWAIQTPGCIYVILHE